MVNHKKIRYKVTVLPDKVMGRYWGMNHEAAKELHFKPLPKKNELFISDRLKGMKVRKILLHEKVECYLMRNRNELYAEAHKVANHFEWQAFIRNRRKKQVKKT